MRKHLLVLAGLLALLSPAKAADSTVSAMTAASALGGTELFYVVQGGADRKATPAQVDTYVRSLMGTGVSAFLNTPSSANLATAVTDETGSGALVFATSPTLVTPALGTPSALVGTNITGTAAGLTAGNVTTNANLTGMVTSVGNAASLGSFTSANLATALTNETGSGAAVFGTAPTITSPTIGTAATFSFITGSTQCLHVDTAGVLSGTGSDCGSGGSGSVTSVTPGGGLVSGITGACTQTAITTTGTISAAECFNAQTGTTYTVLDTDRGKLVTLSNTASIAVTLPQAGTASAFAAGWTGRFKNINTGAVVITPTTSTINGAASLTVLPGQGVKISSDGTNYTSTTEAPTALALTTLTGANPALISSYYGGLIQLNNAANQVPTIAQAGTTGFPSGWYATFCNIGAGTQTITPTTSTIGGAATFVLPAASAARPACVGVESDGTNYHLAPYFPMDASMFSAGTLAVARGGTGITSFGTGVATAMGSNVNTNGGLLTASTAAIASNAIVTGAGSGTALTGTTPGTGVLTALGVNASAAGGVSIMVASGTSALGTSAISSAACATAVTTSATNTATTDVIEWGFNGDPTAVTGYVPLVAGMLTIIAYPSANNVNFKVCNNTSSSITPGAITLNWRVRR